MGVAHTNLPLHPGPCLPACSVQPEGVRATGPQRGSKWQSRAEPGPKHCRQKEEELPTWVTPGGWGLATHLFEDRQTLHLERDMLRFASYRLGPHDPELKDPEKSSCLPLTS